MPIPKCLLPVCNAEGAETLKIECRIPDSPLIEPVMVKFPVCPEHKMSDEMTNRFIDVNWEHICMGFEAQGAKRPVRELTTFKWVPWIDAEIMWAEQAAQKLTKVYKQ